MKKLFFYTLIVFMSMFVFNLNVEANVLNETSNENEILVVDDSTNESDIQTSLDDSDEIEGVIEQNNIEDIANNEEVQVQYTKVSISKLNVDGELLVGAKLQIIDSNGTVIHEWVSDGTIYEIELSAGKYILHEVEAPEGYELASDKEFEIDVIIADEIIGNSDMNDFPCNHGGDNRTPMYYIEINSVSYEVYCINQGLTTPDGIDYNGGIITPEELRDYTKQETDIDAEGFTISGGRINVNTVTIADYDVSDQTLTDQELYDKVLDIIYHRNLVEQDERFSSLTTEEIRFITEFALKNYLNARITTYETVRELDGTKIVHISYNENGELWQEGDGTKYIKLYNKYYNREYIYDESSPTGYIISSGNGDSFGNYAKHWYGNHGKTKIPKEYADLYYYLISDEDKHPESMQLYMYAPLVNSETPYQNLLGITGYIDGVETKRQEVSLVSDYSKEEREISVTKVWEDDSITTEDRPQTITINLYADGELLNNAALSKDNNWSYIFTELNVYDKGKKVIYTIDEVEIEDYETEISGNMEDGFVVTNTRDGIGSTLPPSNENSSINGGLINNPNTGDNYYELLLGLIISFIVVSLATLSIKKRKLIVYL